jgi:hypothetical protein
VAVPWLTVYRNETKVVGRPGMPVIITETGWCRDFCTENDRANWTTSAWEMWHADEQIVAVCPFLLQVCEECMSLCPSIYLFICLSVYLFVRPYVCLNVCLSVCLWSASDADCLRSELCTFAFMLRARARRVCV